MRIDVFLHRVCLARSRSQAGNWCEDGRVRLDGAGVKASHVVRTGQVLEVRPVDRTLKFEILEVPTGQVARNRRESYLKPL